jgi:uncharacterized protein (TIRG00374 family)
MKRAIQLLIGIAISAICVLFSLVDVEPKDFVHPAIVMAAVDRIPTTLELIREKLAHSNWAGFAVICVLTIFAFWVRAVRWQFFIRSERPVSRVNLFSATMIGFMANNILPFRLGEFVRPYVLARRENMSKSTLLATVVVERVIDMLTLLSIFGIALMVSPIGENTPAGRMVQGGARLLLIMSGALTVFVVAAERNRNLAKMFTRMLPAAVGSRVSALLDKFLDGFALFRDLGKLLLVFAMSFGMFGCFAVALWITGWSLGIVLPWYAGLVMLVVTAIGIMIPAAPGYVGTLNIACTAGLALYGVGKAPASAYGWFYFLSQWLPITAVGLYYLHHEGLSLKSLGQAQTDPA